MDSRQLTPNIVNTIKLLRLHGYSYERIARELEISSSSAHRYGKNVEPLPDGLRKDPWEEVQKLQEHPLQKFREKGEFKTALKEKEYWLQEHEECTPFEGPLDLMSLDELKKLMDEPTNYISPLSQTDWYNYYIAPSIFKGPDAQLNNTQILLNHFFDTHKLAIAEVFRGVGKTVLVEGRSVRPICEHRDNNYAIQSEAIERSEERLQVIKNTLSSNKRIIAHYGYLPMDAEWHGIKAEWRKDKITVKRETLQTDPTLKAVSWKDTRLLGGHFHGILFDDPWSSKLEENNEKNKEKWFNWYDSTLLGCMEQDSWQHIICTRKGLYDIYRDLEDRGTFSIYRQPAIWEYPTDYEYIENEQGKIVDVVVRSDDWHISDDGGLLPNGKPRFTIEFLLIKKAQYKHGRKWEMEYQLNPIPEAGVYFKWGDLDFTTLEEFFGQFKSSQELTKVKFMGAMDMARGKSESAHYTALVVCAFWKGKYYLLQSYLMKGASKLDKVKMIQRAKREFPHMNIVYTEADFDQNIYIEDMQGLLKGTGVRLEAHFSRQYKKDIDSLTDKEARDVSKLSSKHARIAGQLDDVTELRLLVVNEKMNHFDEFRREYKEFPRSKYDDLIDAVGSDISKLKRSRYKIFGISG